MEADDADPERWLIENQQVDNDNVNSDSYMHKVYVLAKYEWDDLDVYCDHIKRLAINATHFSVVFACRMGGVSSYFAHLSIKSPSFCFTTSRYHIPKQIVVVLYKQMNRNSMYHE